MKKIIWIFIALVFIGYFTHLHLKEGAKRKAKQAEQKRIERETRSKIENEIKEMVSKTNAIDDWVQNLTDGKKIRFEPILTVELEKLWLNERPILFFGTIKDIATYDQAQYTVIIEKNLLDIRFLCTELRLSLRSPKEKIDSLLANYHDICNGLGFNNGVAVVAHIENIRTPDFLVRNGKREEIDVDEIKIGEGILVEIIYTGNVLFTKGTEE